jgi:predicted ATP-binding protein involved in virulence
MELIYLWVEDYKNIKKQEFVLSSEFTFDYNQHTKTLDIQPNDNIYSDFYGENIKVTAVVGKNGSGKSNLFESIITMIYKTVIPFDDYKVFSVFFDRRIEQFYTKDVEFRINVNQINFNNIEESLCHDKKDKNTFLLSYNYSLDYMYNDENNMSFDSIYHKQDNYEKPILLQPDKSDNKIDLVNIDYLAMRDMLNFTINKSVKFDYIEIFYIPYFYELSVNLNKIHKNQYKANKGIFYEKLKEVLGPHGDSMDFGASLHSLSKLQLIELSQIYILQKTFHLEIVNNFEFIQDVEYKKMLQDLFSEPQTEDTIQRINIVIKYIEQKSFKELYTENLGYKLKKIQQSFKFIGFVLKQTDSFTLSSSVLKIEDNKELLLNLAPWIDIELFDKNKVSFYSLSYGQKFLIKFIYSMLNQLNNLAEHSEYKEIILLLDEVEQGLHPDWQKKLLSFVLKAIKSYTHRFCFNIILSTHSPFIISDLRKENIIFLDDGVVVPGIDKKQTFGANIHTLLSNGFFMQGGLMGAYAKEKIEDVIDFLNGETSIVQSYTEAEKIINIVGEPVLKIRLEQMLSNYKKEHQLETKEEIQSKIDTLQKQLDERNNG